MRAKLAQLLATNPWLPPTRIYSIAQVPNRHGPLNDRLNSFNCLRYTPQTGLYCHSSLRVASILLPCLA